MPFFVHKTFLSPLAFFSMSAQMINKNMFNDDECIVYLYFILLFILLLIYKIIEFLAAVFVFFISSYNL